MPSQVLAALTMQKWLKAKLESPCAICHQTIVVGDRILPYTSRDDHRFRYIHLSCAKQTQAQKAQEGAAASDAPVCKHWRSRGFCLYKDNCVFQHPPELAATLDQQAAVRAAAAQAVPGSNAAMRVSNRRDHKRKATKNRFRAGAFRRWLIDTYGRERLREGAGVLDVAGGKGELAFELVNLNAIPATVVEPRALDLGKRMKWLQIGYYNWNTIFAGYNDRHWISQSAEQSAAEAAGGGEGLPAMAAGSFVLPNHLRVVITQELCEQLGLGNSSSSSDGGNGSSSTDPPGGGSGGEALAGRAVQNHSCIRAANGDGCSSEGGSLLPAGTEGAALAPMAVPPMPPGWPAALQQAQQQAQHSRWTLKGLQHESAAAAGAAEDGGSSSEEDDERDGIEELAAASADPACIAGPRQPPSAAQQAGCMPEENAGGSEGDEEEAGGGQGAAAAGSSLGNCQVASVGVLLDGLFMRMEAAQAAAPAASHCACQQQEGAMQVQAQVQAAAVGDSRVAAHAAMAKALGDAAGGTVAVPTLPSGALEGADQRHGGVGGMGVASFLDGLFARMEVAGQGNISYAPQQPEAAVSAGDGVLAGTSSAAAGCAAAVTAAAELMPGSAAEQQAEQRPVGVGGTGVASFLDGLFARMDLGVQGNTPDAPQHPEAAESAGDGVMTGPVAAAGSARGATAVVAFAPTSAAEQGPSQRPGGVGGAGVASFLDGLFARMEGEAQGQTQAPAAAESAGGGAEAGTPPAPAAATGSAAAGAGAAAADTTPGSAAEPGAEPHPNGVGGAGMASFLDGLFARMEGGVWDPSSPLQLAAVDSLAARTDAAVPAAMRSSAAAAVADPTPGSPAEQGAEPLPGGVGCAGVASFLDGLSARMEGEQQGPEALQQFAAADAGAARIRTAAGGGAAPLACTAVQQPGGGGGLGGAGVISFLDGLFARMEGEGQGTAACQQPPVAAGPAEDGAGVGSAADCSSSAAVAGLAAGAAEQRRRMDLGGPREAAHPSAPGVPQTAAAVGIGGGGGGGAGAGPAALCAQELEDPEEAWRVLVGCSIVVGMHPDQATEFIVDLALKYNKPFAVVPCCVYACEFPRRRLGQQAVTQYHQFVEYLVAKAPGRIRVGELPFEGKNKVVYCM